MKAKLTRVGVMVAIALLLIVLFEVISSARQPIRPRPPGEATRPEVEAAVRGLEEAMQRINESVDQAVYDIHCVTMRLRCEHFPEDPGCPEFLAEGKENCKIELEGSGQSQ